MGYLNVNSIDSVDAAAVGCRAMTDDLSYLSATAALARFRDGSLSPVDLLEALIARAEAVNPAVNAIAERLYGEARSAARAAAEIYAFRPEQARPLEGLPVAAKAEQPIAGRPHTEGSLAFADRVAGVTHPMLERITAAGGIIHIRTTTPEFSCVPFTHSELWGITRNPWNLGLSPGGSSGGSAASLAAGMAPLATGSDIGGSIRYPASCCGVVGFKPPYGRVPSLPPFNLDAYCHDGPLARTVQDCALLQNVVVGPHPRDAVSLRPAVTIPDTLDGVDGMRVALAVRPGDWVMVDDVEANTRAVGEALARAGAVVEEVELGLRRTEVARALDIHLSAVLGALAGDGLAEFGDLLTTYARRYAQRATPQAAPGSFVEGLQIEAAIYDRIGPVLDTYDAIVCPTSGVPAVVAGEDYIDHESMIGGEPANPLYDALMTPPFNIVSRCPVLAVPSGRAADGVPTGVQIVGRTYDDATVFRLGAALEAARPWGYGDERLDSRLTGQPVTSGGPA
jgi:aspartyl-tRNA(Asn)/glutamyl-tRNA(Gln) amidotransferase subunit A